MNKKVSTIFAMAALMGGVFSGSAYAVELSSFPANSNNPIAASAFNNGTQVVLSQQVGRQTLLLGYEKTGSNPSAVSVIDAASPIEDTDVLNYAWRVFVHRNTANTQNVYSFINVATGDTLSFDTTGAVRITDRSNEVYATDSNGRYNFTWGTGTPSEYNGAAAVMNAEGVSTGSFALSLTPESVSLNGSANTILSALTSASVPDEDLNTLYNGKGFNLGAQPIPDIPGAVEDNLFAGESQIWAYDVDEPAGYYVVGTASNGDELRIPNGKYFFSNAIFNGGRGASDFMSARLGAENINWLASTLIAVSPTEISETTDATRANGEGFKLVEVKGSDFIFDQNTSIPEGDDISIFNACFTVETDYTAQANYPYALSLGTFYYQRSAQFAGTDDQSSSNEVYLGVSSYSNSNQRVVSKAGTPEHVFNLNSSSVVDGRTLLNDTPTPAVYTIQFVDGTSGDRNLMDKYLTVGANEQGTAFQWEAKGAALANLDYPIFQYVITSARPASDRYINVTFTNRETGQNFTAQLFPEGENLYSLAISAESTDPTTNVVKVQPYTVNSQGSNTYDVETLGNPIELDSDITVRLQKVENVDNYAGFLNVDNEEIRTLAFARDVNSTSNRLYSDVTVAWRDQDYTNGHAYLSHSWNEYIDQVTADYFTDEHSDAAQWQLIKSASPASISRVIVYHNTNTNSVDDVANGDRINAYVYALRYVEDGTATNFFLSNDLPTPASVSTYWNTETYRDLQVLTSEEVETLPNTIRNHNELNFIIKENVDGSVSLIAEPNAMVTGRTTQSGEDTYVAAFNEAKALELESVTNRLYTFTERVYATVPNSAQQYDVKTYLDPQPIEISWPAKEGHVTIESELGNYITMNENRDAIVVNEEEADDYYLYVTDNNAVIPSFYITKGVAAANGERMFMFNPTDSVSYYVASGDYDRQYQWAEGATKVMFKAATINDTRDTLTINVKGETKYIAKEADDNNADIWGGIKRFKFQIVETGDEDGHYYIRQANATDNNTLYGRNVAGNYLSALNEKVTWSDKSRAMIFTVAETSAPTANESVSATEVKVVATDGAINIKNAAGKNVVISTILGQIVANEVLTSDNATISVPAGIAIVSVDGEEAVKVSVK